MRDWEMILGIVLIDNGRILEDIFRQLDHVGTRLHDQVHGHLKVSALERTQKKLRTTRYTRTIYELSSYGIIR